MEARTITQAQASRLWTIARIKLKLQDSEVRAVLREFGVTSTKLIPLSEYEAVMQRLTEYAKAEF